MPGRVADFCPYGDMAPQRRSPVRDQATSREMEDQRLCEGALYSTGPTTEWRKHSGQGRTRADRAMRLAFTQASQQNLPPCITTGASICNPAKSTPTGPAGIGVCAACPFLALHLMSSRTSTKCRWCRGLEHDHASLYLPHATMSFWRKHNGHHATTPSPTARWTDAGSARAMP